MEEEYTPFEIYLMDVIKSNAIEFAEWVEQKGYYKSDEGNFWYRPPFDHSHSSEELYELFINETHK